MVNIAEVKKVMDECSTPFQMPLVDFVSRALEINEDVFGALLHKRTKKDILTYLKSSSVTFEDLSFLLVRIVASLNKYCGIINIIKSKEDAIFLIENGIDLIPPRIDELFDAIEDIIASSQKELDELEEARANMLEDIEQKRNQILQRMEALRSRVAKLGAKQENIQPKKDERIREMEGK